MAVGIMLSNYETVGSERKGSQVQLVSTIGMLTVAKDRAINDRYKLGADLTAEVKIEGDKYVAVDYWVDEFGIGDSLQEAQQDLLDSLVDYLLSLERRENRLGDKERFNLQLLRSMVVRR